jgi:hypothetical protein
MTRRAQEKEKGPPWWVLLVIPVGLTYVALVIWGIWTWLLKPLILPFWPMIKVWLKIQW